VFLGEAPAPAFSADSVRTRTMNMSAASGGYAATPIDRSRRSGFGPKVKEKNPGNGLLIALGVLGLIACGAAVFMFNQMGS
jgi:hypothetical protein